MSSPRPIPGSSPVHIIDIPANVDPDDIIGFLTSDGLIHPTTPSTSYRDTSNLPPNDPAVAIPVDPQDDDIRPNRPTFTGSTHDATLTPYLDALAEHHAALLAQALAQVDTARKVINEDISANEDDTLLVETKINLPVEPKKQTWGAWLKHYTYEATIGTVKATANTLASGVKSAYEYVLTKPKDAVISATKHSLAFIISLIATAPSVINALVAPSGKDPKDISSSWWNNMNIMTRLHTVMNAFSSYYVNAPLNKQFMLGAIDRLKVGLREMFKGPRQFFDNSASMILGISGGIASGSIALGAFGFLPIYIAGTLATIGFLTNATSRYLSSKKGFNRIHNVFNHDARVQKELIDALNHVREEYLQLLQRALNKKSDRLLQRHVITEKLIELHCSAANKNRADITDDEINSTLAPQLLRLLNSIKQTGTSTQYLLKHENLSRCTTLIKQHVHGEWRQTLNNHDYELLFKHLASVLEKMDAVHPNQVQVQHIEIFDEKTRSEYIAAYTSTMFDLIFATLLIALPCGAIFMQKGYDGFNALKKLAEFSTIDKRKSTWDLTLDDWYKRGIGFLPALASFMMYDIWGIEFRKTIYKTGERIAKHPQELLGTLFWLATNYFACSSMENIARGVLNKENILGKDLTSGQLDVAIPILLRIGGFVVNWAPEAQSQNNQANTANTQQPSVATVIARFEDPNINRISTDCADKTKPKLNQLSFFANSATHRIEGPRLAASTDRLASYGV